MYSTHHISHISIQWKFFLAITVSCASIHEHVHEHSTYSKDMIS
jgi:hypothetical protein